MVFLLDSGWLWLGQAVIQAGRPIPWPRDVLQALAGVAMLKCRELPAWTERRIKKDGGFGKDGPAFLLYFSGAEEQACNLCSTLDA